MKSVLLVVDEGWSTGTIAKDLRHILKDWRIDFISWAAYPPDLEQILTGYDAVVAFCLLSPHAWPPLMKHGVICCGKVELDLLRFRNSKVAGTYFGAVSKDAQAALEEHVKPVYYTPGSARLSRFTRGEVIDRPMTLGWCGVPQSSSNFWGIDAKRFSMFEEIVKATGTKSLVSYKNYDYASMHQFYESIDLLLCTSASEGGPLPVFEAIACGVPALSTDVGLVKETSIVKFDTVERAVDLVNCLKVPERRLDYINELYADFEQHWCMEKLAPHWEKFFTEIAKKGEV